MASPRYGFYSQTGSLGFRQVRLIGLLCDHLQQILKRDNRRLNTQSH